MMSLALVWLAGASGFVLPAQPALPRPGPAAAAAAATAAAAAASAPTVLRPHAAPPRAAPGAVQMGLFGLGYPELAVIGLVGIVLLGPERLVPMARDLGSASQPSLTRAPVRSRGPCARAARAPLALPAWRARRQPTRARRRRRADPSPRARRRQECIRPQGGLRLLRPGHGRGRGAQPGVGVGG